MKLSVVIPARDEEGSITQTLDGVASALSDAGIEHEILVIDDGSTDATRALVEEFAASNPVVRCHRSHTNPASAWPCGLGWTVHRRCRRDLHGRQLR